MKPKKLGTAIINKRWKYTKSGGIYANGFFGGYPGLTRTAKRISEYIPHCKLFAEPFAGLGRVSKKVKADRYALNDMSDFAYEFLNKHFNAEITKMDFVDFIKLYDSKNTFFFIDPPWRKMLYDSTYTLAFCDRTVKEYYQELFELMPKLKADWMIAGDVHEKETGKLIQNSGYTNLIIKTNYKMLGGTIQVRLCSNKPFQRYHQSTLVNTDQSSYRKDNT
jgi:site-specific DNA-adenine methylase